MRLQPLTIATASLSVCDWALPLLRCPCCMSALAPATSPAGPVLCCGACARAYPLQTPDGSSALIAELMRDDALATMAQDMVNPRGNPESMRSNRPAKASRVEQRELFLRGLIQDVSRTCATHAAHSEPRRSPPSAGAMNALDRFAALLPARAVVLDAACDQGAWAAHLAERGLRVIGVCPHPTAPSPAHR